MPASRHTKHPKLVKVICHGRPTLRRAVRLGWLPGARYTNMRDIRGFDSIGFIDIDWEDYSFERHLQAVKATSPMITVARDLTHLRQLPRLLEQVATLRQYVESVVIVPKVRRFSGVRLALSGTTFTLGYSVPTGYGETELPLRHFRGADVHLLGGRPMTQYRLAAKLDVVSLDCNSVTIDAAFGKYFDGARFRKHPRGGYLRCITDSLIGINDLWASLG